MKSLLHAWHQISPRRLFLLDGLGAVLSALSLGVVLPAFESVFGVPARVLSPLALLAVGLAAYSFLCFWGNAAQWRPLLQGLALANLLYGGLTAALLWCCAPNVTAWGGLYIGLELTVVTLLACGELHKAARPKG